MSGIEIFFSKQKCWLKWEQNFYFLNDCCERIKIQNSLFFFSSLYFFCVLVKVNRSLISDWSEMRKNSTGSCASFLSLKLVKSSLGFEIELSFGDIRLVGLIQLYLPTTYIAGGSCTRLDFKLSAHDVRPCHYIYLYTQNTIRNWGEKPQRIANVLLLFFQVCMRNVGFSFFFIRLKKRREREIGKKKVLWLCFAFLLISVNWHCNFLLLNVDLLFNDIQQLHSRNECKKIVSRFLFHYGYKYMWIIRSLTKSNLFISLMDVIMWHVYSLLLWNTIIFCFSSK